MKFFIYHATDSTIDKFNLEHLGFGEHNFGPGIYFSTKADNIDFYLNDNKDNGKIYKTEIDISGMVLYYDLVTDENIIKNLVNSLPFTLTQKEENDLISKYTNKNYLYIFDNLPYETSNLRPNLVFPNDETLKNFLINMYNKTGINSMFVENGTFRNEIVVFNPNILTIKENILENNEINIKNIISK